MLFVIEEGEVEISTCNCRFSITDSKCKVQNHTHVPITSPHVPYPINITNYTCLLKKLRVQGGWDNDISTLPSSYKAIPSGNPVSGPG